MGLLTFLGDVVKPVADLIDNLHTSGEEKLTLHSELTRVENTFAEKVLDYEQKITQMQADVIMTEAKGESWLQQSWRPITMLTFLVLVVLDSLGLLTHEIPPQMWTLLELGLGGYVIGRSAEKIVPAVVDKFSKKEG
ncbi:MAG: 3TM-type holin [Patescibacteria group bacterium]|jgi:hypothetical protein